MPTQIIRPNATNSQAGMNPSSNIHTVINDNRDASFANQSAASAVYKLEFGNTSGLGSATIEKFVFSFRAMQDRRPGATVVVTLQDGAGQAYSNFTLGGSGFDGTKTTYDSSDFTTQQDGSTALDASYLDGLEVIINPSSQGHRVFDMFVTVTYSTGYGNTVAGISGISEVIGIATANISKVIGI